MSIVKVAVTRSYVLAILVISLVLIQLLVSCKAPTEISELDSRTNSLNKSIMCPVCPGESIDQSQNELAAHMRRIVREQIERQSCPVFCEPGSFVSSMVGADIFCSLRIVYTCNTIAKTVIPLPPKIAFMRFYE